MGTLDHYIQGSFTADGNGHILSIRSDVDFIEVDNLTRIETPQAGTGVKFRWQRGMPVASALQEKTDGSGNMSTSQILTGGFSPVTTTQPVPSSPLLTGTTITNAAPPVASSANTGALANGNIVKIINATGAPQLNGYDFTVNTVVANTSFNLQYMIAPGNAATAFTYRFYTQNAMFYPRRNFVVNVTQATQAVVTLSITHGLTAGQEVVFTNFGKFFGMTQLNNVRATIQSVNTTNNTVTINVDTTGFTAWTFPTATNAATPFTPAQMIPFGDGLDPTNTLQTSATLAGATQNQAVIGMFLAGGANGPAGQSGDVIYWRAWKAEQIQTTFFS
jgi:hypothetical protein